MKSDEEISSIVAVKEFSESFSLVMATKMGNIKKTNLSLFSNPRKGGIVGMGLTKGDALIGTALSNGKKEILLATKAGKALRFPEKLIRDMGRSAKGVRGINLGKDDQVVSMVVFASDIGKTGSTLLSVTEKGYAKRSDFNDYRTQSRGGKGVINVKITDRNGRVVGVLDVMPDDEIMAVSKEGMIVRCSPDEIRQTGRSAVGVRLISLKGKDKVMSIANVVAKDA